MLIVMKANATPDEIDAVCDAIREIGYTPHPIPGESRTAIGITGNDGPVQRHLVEGLPGVVEAIRVTQPFKLTNREMQPDDSLVPLGESKIGSDDFVVIAGPCGVESREQTLSTARCVAAHGATAIRAGAFKPRTSPYSFQGMGEDGLKILADARAETGLPIVSEVVDVESFDLVEKYVDVLQIGSRNMQNFSLLKRAGKSDKPVLLKRWMSGTLKEFLLAAEYILSEGNRNVILCERGIRAFSDYSRFTLDITIVPELKQRTHLPVIIDPSHAAGKRDLVIPLARAAAGVGADGIIVEVHPEPAKALSDGPQALTFPMFEELMGDIQRMGPSLGRNVKVPSLS